MGTPSSRSIDTPRSANRTVSTVMLSSVHQPRDAEYRHRMVRIAAVGEDSDLKEVYDMWNQYWK